MKTIFKKGDKVFDIRYGWGEVTALTMEEVKVGFSEIYLWYDDSNESLKLLSFTEYTLEGFSQERPYEFKDGDSVWVSDFDGEEWMPRVFKKYENNLYYTYNSEGDYVEWEQCKPFKTEEDEK